MNQNARFAPATSPEDLAELFVQRARVHDVDGVLALYEPGAVLALPNNKTAVGAEAIRQSYLQLFAVRSQFEIKQQRPALVLDDLALPPPQHLAP